jgi:hypothetical protein
MRAHNVTIDGDDYAAVDGVNVMILDLAQHRDTFLRATPQPPRKHKTAGGLSTAQSSTRLRAGRPRKITSDFEGMKGHG